MYGLEYDWEVKRVSIQERIKEDYIKVMKAKNKSKVDDYRIILGEFARSRDKEIPDNIVVNILKGLLKSEKEMWELTKSGVTGNPYSDLLESYLPKQVGEDEIKKWINENVDFNSLKNKMQAIGLVTKHFGVGVDGNLVKSIIQSF